MKVSKTAAIIFTTTWSIGSIAYAFVEGHPYGSVVTIGKYQQRNELSNGLSTWKPSLPEIHNLFVFRLLKGEIR